MKISEYITETRAELKHVNWPTRRQGIVYTIIVIIISVGTGAFLGIFDSLFAGLVKLFI